MTDGRAGIDAALVRRLIADQFPQWGELPVRPVEVDGWDNRTYRLGDDMTVRLPTDAAYEPAIEKEHRWLPALAPHVPLPIPTSLEVGRPAYGYPHAWSVRRWLAGAVPHPGRIADLCGFAVAVGEFVLALQGIDAAGGPTAGAHSFFRGTPPAHYDKETQRALATLAGRIDSRGAARVWQAALDARFEGPPTWFHGDIASGNLLVREGRLAAVIDFGTCGVGDPACDLVIAWTMFRSESRAAYRETVRQDAGTWARARGWALWKALITLAADTDKDPASAEVNEQVIAEILGEVV